MGARNRSSVRTEHRDGRKILIIDFRFKDKDGREQRYRRDASVQTAAGACPRSSLEAPCGGTQGARADPEVPTFAISSRATSRGSMVRFKPSTREGYGQLLCMPEHGLVALPAPQAA